MGNDESGSGGQPTPVDGAPTPTRDMGEQVRKVIPEDEAAATGLVIGGMLEDLAAETQADPSPYRKPAPEHLSPFQRDMRAINDDEYEERSGSGRSSGSSCGRCSRP